jgi:Spo0E like sporulation regulatory protein.
MNEEIQKLKEKLDKMVANMPLNCEEVLRLSMEVDLVIVEYYRQ